MVIEISGNWAKGFSLDLHTIESTYLGVNDQGYDQWDTTRSDIGELVYQLKYRKNLSVVPEIIGHINRKIEGLASLDYIVPVPASKIRSIQPVYVIAKALGESLSVPVLENYVFKKTTEEIKDVDNLEERERLLRESITLSGEVDISGKNVLLLDDLYRSGVTLKVVTDILYNKAKVQNVFVLTMTKTRSKR